MIGTVPVYDSVIHYQRDLDTLTARDFIDVVRLHAEDGVDFVTLHCGITRKTIDQIRNHQRKMNIVSRGGSLVFAWMCMTGNENPFYEYFDEILEICREYDVTISLGDACRPGCLADASVRFIIGNYRWWERPFYTIGLCCYDLLAGRLGLGRSLPLSKKQTLKELPALDELVAAISESGPLIDRSIYKEENRRLSINEAIEVVEESVGGERGFTRCDEDFLYLQLCLEEVSATGSASASFSVRTAVGSSSINSFRLSLLSSLAISVNCL